jgi:hypothetical protein
LIERKKTGAGGGAEEGGEAAKGEEDCHESDMEGEESARCDLALQGAWVLTTGLCSYLQSLPPCTCCRQVRNNVGPTEFNSIWHVSIPQSPCHHA